MKLFAIETDPQKKRTLHAMARRCILYPFRKCTINKVPLELNYSESVGEPSYVPLIGVMCEGCPRDGVPKMATQCAQFEPVAWWWTRNQIGRDLRELYEVPKELPSKLLGLVRKLDAVEDNQLSKRSLIDAPPAEPRSVGPSENSPLLGVLIVIMLVVGSTLSIMNKACKSGYHSWCAPMSTVVRHHVKTRPPA